MTEVGLLTNEHEAEREEGVADGDVQCAEDDPGHHAADTEHRQRHQHPPERGDHCQALAHAAAAGIRGRGGRVERGRWENKSPEMLLIFRQKKTK